jgi:hypothetical protein
MITTTELVTTIHRLLTPNFIKRKQIRPLLAEYNSRAELRNKAYPKADPWPLLLDTLDQQNGASLDKTYDYLYDQIETGADWSITAHTYWELIVENEKREARRKANDEADAFIIVKMKEESNE